MKRILLALAIILVPTAAYSQIPLLEDTAYTLPVNMLPLVDSAGDIDETIAYNETNMEVHWNFLTEAGVFTSTQVTPTTGGVHDWAHVNGGMYTMEIPATGGDAANDTAGTGWWTGKSDGVLVFSSPRYSFSVFATAADNAAEVETTLTDRLPSAAVTTRINTSFATDDTATNFATFFDNGSVVSTVTMDAISAIDTVVDTIDSTMIKLGATLNWTTDQGTKATTISEP
jgi:flagellin-like hook-associated protein FlgL